MTIQRIDRIVTVTTEEKESAAWAETLSHRNKLLANTDWTQLPDAGLTPECVTAMRSWREAVKTIKRSTYPVRAHAERHIETLTRRLPKLQYLPLEIAVPEADRYDDLEEFRTQVTRYMEVVFNATLSGSFLDNHILVEEQFREALDYNSGVGEQFPLMAITAELYGQPMKHVADEFIGRKVNSVKRMSALKKQYYKYQSLVSKAASDVELQDIQADITLWISTST